MQRLIFKLRSPRYPLLMHYNHESVASDLIYEAFRRRSISTRAIRWKNNPFKNIYIYKKKKPFLIGHESSVSPLEPHYYPPPTPCSNILLPPLSRRWPHDSSRDAPVAHMQRGGVVAVCRKTMPSSSHGHAAGLHQPPKITRAAPVKRAGQRPSIYRGKRATHWSSTRAKLWPSSPPVDRPKWNYATPKVAPYVRRDRSKKKRGRRRKEVKTMDGRTTPSSSSLPSFPFVEIVEFK